MITQEDKEALRVMREEMEAAEKKAIRERDNANHKGRILDQIELCYKQYTPAQNLGR